MPTGPVVCLIAEATKCASTRENATDKRFFDCRLKHHLDSASSRSKRTIQADKRTIQEEFGIRTIQAEYGPSAIRNTNIH